MLCVGYGHNSLQFFFVRAFMCFVLLFASPLRADGEFIFQRYGISEGLSQVSILSIAEDRDGFLWLGTEDGLNRFDGIRFDAYYHHNDEPDSLYSSYINVAIPLRDGNVLVFNGGGIDLFHPAARRATHLQSYQNEDGVHHVVNSYKVDKSGDVWIADDSGLLHYSVAKKQLRHIKVWDDKVRPLWHQAVTALGIANNGQLYVASLAGLRLFDIETDRFLPELPQWLSQLHIDSRITHIVNGQRGELLIADKNKLNTLLAAQKSVSAETFAQMGLDQPPGAILCDQENRLWIATGKGLYFRNSGVKQFQKFSHKHEYSDSIPDNMLTHLLQDRQGNIWLGSYTAGLAKLSANGVNIRYFSPPPETTATGSNTIAKLSPLDEHRVALVTPDGWVSEFDVNLKTVKPFSPFSAVDVVDPAPAFISAITTQNGNEVWLASNNGIFRQRQNDKAKRYLVPRYKQQLYSDTWSDTAVDEKDHVWFLNAYTGLYRWDSKHDQLSAVAVKNIGLLNDNVSPFRFVRVKDEGFWISTSSSKLYFWRDDEAQAKTYLLQCKNVERVFDILPRIDGSLWLASNVGALQFFPHNGDCIDWNARLNAPSMVANAIQIDALGNLWVSTNRGIAHYDLHNMQFRLYNQNDGFHFGEFNVFSSLKIRDQFMFGGTRGLAVFDPMLTWKGDKTAVTISDVMVNYGHEILAKRLTNADFLSPLHLKREHSNIALQFSGSDLSAAAELQFDYRLLGSQTEQWVSTTALNRQANFTALTPGTYQFEVRARRAQSAWGPSTLVPIIIAPAWWETTIAKFSYLTLAIALIVLAWRWRTLLLRRRNEVLSRAVQQRTNEIESLLKQRTRLFANVSHELRTPLTLISGPLSDLVNEPMSDSMRKKVHMIQENSERLTTLVDQVLAITHLQDHRGEHLRKQSLALKPHLLALLESYEAVARRGGIRLSWGPIENIDVVAASDLPEVVFGNLISNAIKYTNSGGNIHVSLLYQHEPPCALFEIKDSGIGMNSDEILHIFEPFYRAQHEERHNALLPHSSGLGLPHVKAMLELHEGQIEVSSEVGVGSVFRVYLPALLSLLDEDVSEIANVNEEQSEKAHLLIVEDNPSLNSYLKQIFSDDYSCHCFANGADAEAFAYEHTPDLVLSDVRLPIQDGLTLAQHLKNDVRTSHIPIILVSAVADQAIKLSALHIQVDDFVAKPFDVPTLKLKVRNLLQRQQRIVSTPSPDHAIATSDDAIPTINPLDQRFMQQLDALLDVHIGNAEFELDDLSRHLYLSKKQLQRKIKVLTGLSPMEYFRQRRIAKACELLKAGRTITDVCYSVGFSSQSYFTTCFKQQIGETPRIWQQQHSGHGTVVAFQRGK